MLSILPRPQAPACFEEHYGLAQRPFAQTLDQHFVFASRSYTTALQEVRRALQRREGLVVVTGETGTGKTMLCRTLVDQLGRWGGLETPACVSIVLDPHVTVDDLLLHVLADFGVIMGRRQAGVMAPTRHQLMRALQQCLASLIPAGAYAVLVIDEAQELDPSVLEQLRLLLNLETDEAKLLQIVLIGRPDLNGVLQRPDMRQLDQRVAGRCELAPLTPEEVKSYVDHRLSMAQRLSLFADIEGFERQDTAVDTPPCNVSFTRSAVRTVAELSGGIPRVINRLCDRALDIGYERRAHTIDARIVRAAAARLNARAFTAPALRVTRETAMAMATLGVVIAGMGIWAWDGGRAVPAPPSPPAALAAVAVSNPWALGTAANVRPLDVVNSFNVRVASSRVESNAAALAAQLEAARLPAFTRRRPGSVLHHVIVGPYLSEGQTVAVRELLAGYGHPDTDVFVESPFLKP